MQFAALLALLMIATSSQASDCKRHPLYCSITELNPRVDKSLAMSLSNYIAKYSKLYGTDPYRSIAIAMQESTFRNIHRKQDVVVISEECSDDGECIEFAKLFSGYTDIGVWQFHARTILAFGMDALRLRDDLEYATERHCFLLSVKLKECSRLGDDAWACYHSKTPKYRDAYIEKVDHYYNRITNKKESN